MIPVFNGRVLDVYIARTFGGAVRVDHFLVNSLSSQIGVGPVCGKPSCESMERRYCATFPEETAARNLASFELVAYPVVDRRLQRSLASEISTYS